MTDRKNSWFLLVQLCLYFLAIGFSSEGGNSPVYAANSLIYLKVALLSLPVICTLLAFIVRPYSCLQALKTLISLNRYLLMYFILCLMTIPFAVLWEYSLTRLFYTLASFLSLLALMAQYAMTPGTDIRKHLIFLTCFCLLFPCYTLFTNFNFGIPDFRNNLQSINLVHPNILASFYAQLLIWNLSLNRRSSVGLGLSLLLAFFIFLLFSRSVFIALLITGVLISAYAFFSTRQKNVLAYIFTFALIATIAFVSILINPYTLHNLMTWLSRNGDVDSLYTLTNRTSLWSYLLENLDVKTAFFGFGYSVIDRNFGVDFGTGILYGAHNAYLSILLGSGVLALLAILLYFFSVFQNYLKTYPLTLRYAGLSSLVLFILNCFLSEEIGVNFSITFALVVLMHSCSQSLKQ